MISRNARSRPAPHERDEEERYDRALFDRLGELGFTSVPFPSEIGGAGFSYRAWTLVMEEIAYADMALAVSLSVHILSQYPVITWGTDEQKAPLASRHARRQADGRVRADRAPGRLRCICAEAARRPHRHRQRTRPPTR